MTKKRRKRGLKDTRRKPSEPTLFDFLSSGNDPEVPTPEKRKSEKSDIASRQRPTPRPTARKSGEPTISTHKRGNHQKKKSDPPKPLTVAQLAMQIRKALSDTFPRSVLVQGEISNFTVSARGHVYFSLKDSENSIPAILWRSAAEKLKFEPDNGMEVICRGRVEFYEVRGTCQLVVSSIQPVGAGELQLAFEQLKKKLTDAGLFDSSRKRPIPFLPRRIAIVTSEAAAALRDILRVIWRRFPEMHVILSAAQVQGDGAAESIAAAIDRVNQAQCADTLIVARGGGSMEDLWAFNEEPVVRAIARSRIPVISGVGHEIDTTLADFAADRRAATPSAAAELAVPLRSDLATDLDSLSVRLEDAMRARIESLRGQLKSFEKSYALMHPKHRLSRAQQRLDELSDRLPRAIRAMIRVHRKKLESTAIQFRLTSPARKIEESGRKLEHLHSRMQSAVQSIFQEKANRMNALAGKLESLSPLSVLSRGFSVTRDIKTGKIIRDATETKRGDSIRTQLSRGTITSEIIDIQPE